MLTIKEVLLRTSGFFEEKGIDNPRLNAELLLSHGLGLPSRLDLYLQHDRPLEERELESIRPLVKRRSKGEPVQYIEGKANFMGVDFDVDERVLIPRPETEELVSLIEELLEGVKIERILDVGTGSGILALSMARVFEAAEVLGVDVSPDALEVARQNAQKQGLSDRVDFRVSNWYGEVNGQFDLIVSNPPYLTRQELHEAASEVRDFEPTQALVSSGEHGEECLFTVMEGAKERLLPGGVLALETGISQKEILEAKAIELGYQEYWGEQDLSGRERFFFVRN